MAVTNNDVSETGVAVKLNADCAPLAVTSVTKVFVTGNDNIEAVIDWSAGTLTCDNKPR